MKNLRDFGEDMENGKVEINLAPMLDMIFLLLIFFMVTAVFVKNTATKIDKPEAKNASEKIAKFSVEISAEGEIFIDGVKSDLDFLEDMVKNEVKNGEKNVTIFVDKKTETGVLIAVSDCCKVNGLENVNIATK